MLAKSRVCYSKLASAARITIAADTAISDMYLNKRKIFLEEEQKQSVGGRLILSHEEMLVNRTLMSHKFAELDAGFTTPAQFPPARSFLDSIGDIEKSEVFKFLRRMPKGAVLHGHDTALVSAEFIVKKLTYLDNLYAKMDAENNLTELHFYQTPPDAEWKSVKEMRESDVFRQDGTTFDDWLMSQLTLTKKDIGLDVNTVWDRFIHIFLIITPMLTYEPVWKEHFYQTLKEFHEDNVNYLEFRGTLPEVYKLDGTLLNEIEVCQLYVDTLARFKLDYPQFFGARLIYAPIRSVDEDTFLGYLNIARELKRMFPDFIAGFDLVGQEDLGETLVKFAKDLLEMQNEMDFFFHAGETNWSGFSTDDNLVDAVLLGTKRIGHGYALTKHPRVAQAVKEKHIGIEVCPISNQVLGLVQDMRNHPGTHLLTNDYPVVIAPDDPGFWGAKGVSYDWYEAFMGLAAKWQDLRLLKQLAVNSIDQTSLDAIQKEKLLQDWKRRWDVFISHVNNS